MSNKETTESPLDSMIIDQLRALQRPGDPDMLQELADIYVEDAAKAMRTLHEALNAGDARRVYETAHTLKSSSASLGARRLAAVFEKLERMGRTAALDGAGDLLVTAEVEFTAACTALRAESRRAEADRPRLAGGRLRAA